MATKTNKLINNAVSVADAVLDKVSDAIRDQRTKAVASTIKDAAEEISVVVKETVVGIIEDSRTQEAIGSVKEAIVTVVDDVQTNMEKASDLLFKNIHKATDRVEKEVEEIGKKVKTARTSNVSKSETEASADGAPTSTVKPEQGSASASNITTQEGTTSKVAAE